MILPSKGLIVKKVVSNISQESHLFYPLPSRTYIICFVRCTRFIYIYIYNRSFPSVVSGQITSKHLIITDYKTCDPLSKSHSVVFWIHVLMYIHDPRASTFWFSLYSFDSNILYYHPKIDCTLTITKYVVQYLVPYYG